VEGNRKQGDSCESEPSIMSVREKTLSSYLFWAHEVMDN
jgi:hypothetical protein